MKEWLEKHSKLITAIIVVAMMILVTYSVCRGIKDTEAIGIGFMQDLRHGYHLNVTHCEEQPYMLRHMTKEGFIASAQNLGQVYYNYNWNFWIHFENDTYLGYDCYWYYNPIENWTREKGSQTIYINITNRVLRLIEIQLNKHGWYKI